MIQKTSRISMMLWIGLAAVAMILVIPGSYAGLPLSGTGGLSLSGTGSSMLHGSASALSGYSLPKSPLLSQGYSTTLLNSGGGFTLPTQNQASTGTILSTGGSSQLSGLFSSAMSNYYTNPPKPIGNPSPSGFLTPALGSDTSWDALFNPPVYHGCGCG